MKQLLKLGGLIIVLFCNLVLVHAQEFENLEALKQQEEEEMEAYFQQKEIETAEQQLQHETLEQEFAEQVQANQDNSNLSERTTRSSNTNDYTGSNTNTPALAALNTNQKNMPNPSGDFDYTIPIEIPPGIMGVAPTLSLVYNSSRKNGMLGWGWALAGLPSISKTYYKNANKMDTFVGPEGRLVHTGSNVYFAVNGTGTNKYVLDGDQWTVSLSNGSVAIYEKQFEDSYAITSFSDKYGNKYIVSYDKKDGFSYPNNINYTIANGVNNGNFGVFQNCMILPNTFFWADLSTSY